MAVEGIILATSMILTLVLLTLSVVSSLMGAERLTRVLLVATAAMAICAFIMLAMGLGMEFKKAI